MVLKPVYYPPSSDQPNMQYPPVDSSQSRQEDWQSAPPSGTGYVSYRPPQGSPLYPVSSPSMPSRPYAPPDGQNAGYYSNAEQPPAYPSAWSERQYNSYSPQQPYGALPYQQPYQSPPQGPYGYEHPNANPFGQPPAAPTASTAYGSPEIKQEEEGLPPQGYGPQTEEERGLMGAVAGAAAGGYAGHKMHHGFLGTLGGAYAGHKLEDAYKDHQKHSKPPSPAAPAAQPPPARNQQQVPRGNFSASSTDITLDRDHDLIASCTNVQGRKQLSSISLNNAITNDNGHFKWVTPGSEPGKFGASARNVRLVDGGRVLEAELCCCNGTWRKDAIRLDEKIENSDGDLRMV